MCRKHLLGEHLECHMFVSTINAGKSVTGYLEGGLLEIHSLRRRHDALVEEMIVRGYNHASPLPAFPESEAGFVNVVRSIIELRRRCPECRALWHSCGLHFLDKAYGW